jgi:predicted RNA-binding protein YlxR (DUF448 family)
VKRQPQRTCVACRRVRPKRELIRLVTGAGGIEVDATEKREGRGAYICPEPACWEKALKGAALEKALRGKLSREQRERLMEQGRKILKELTGAEGQ